jgi:hypothetical protein
MPPSASRTNSIDWAAVRALGDDRAIGPVEGDRHLGLRAAAPRLDLQVQALLLDPQRRWRSSDARSRPT